METKKNTLGYLKLIKISTSLDNIRYCKQNGRDNLINSKWSLKILLNKYWILLF